MDIYRELILDHYKNPRNFGHLDNPDAKTEEGNVTCGDRIVMEITVNGKKEISDIRFSGEGCAISQASASLLTERAVGKPVDSLLALKAADIIKMLGVELTASRTKCAVLPLEVLHKTILSLKK
jgi:nitrogen fixation NifU-like protein